MINTRVLRDSCSDEVKAFFYKMIGDNYRYIAENAKDALLEDVKQKALAAYERAYAIYIPASKPLKLDLALCYSYFCCTCLGDYDAAYQI